MITNQMIGAVRSVLVPEQRSEVSFSVESTAEMNTGNYFYIGHGEKKKIERNSEPQVSQISNKTEESALKRRKAELEGGNEIKNGHGTVHLV